jgi:hypothetical protein
VIAILPAAIESGSVFVGVSKFQITMTKIQNSKPVLVIEYWNLRFVFNLVLGI